MYIKKRKEFPTRYSATRKDPISKVIYLKRGHLRQRNLSSRVEVCKEFGVSLSTETQHCPWKKERKPTQHNGICICFIKKKYILHIVITGCIHKFSVSEILSCKQSPPRCFKNQHTQSPLLSYHHQRSWIGPWRRLALFFFTWDCHG